MTAYDEKSAVLSASEDCTITLEVDVDGTGLWMNYRSFQVSKGQSPDHTFPDGFSAYWVRATASVDAIASVQFSYR